MKAFGTEITLNEIKGVWRFLFSKRFLSLFLAVSLIMLLMPTALQEKLHLTWLEAACGDYFGLVVLILMPVLSYRCVADFIVWNRERKMFKGKDAEKRIFSLNAISQGYLCMMYNDPGHSAHLNPQDANVVILERRRMIGRGNLGRLDNWHYYLLPWVEEFFAEHEEFFEGWKAMLKEQGVDPDKLYQSNDDSWL